MQNPDSVNLALDPPALAGFVVRDLAGGRDVVLLVDPLYGVAMLEQVGALLLGGRDRVVRVSAEVPGGLNLAELLLQLGQCGGQVRLDQTAPAPEQDIVVLTTLDPSCDRIVLLVDHAELLEHSALLAIQLACRASIRLRLVFAGLPGTLMNLDHPELSTLEGRLLRGVRYTTVADEADTVMSEAMTVQEGRFRQPFYAAAACAALAVIGGVTYWSTVQRNTSVPASVQVAAAPFSLPMPSREQLLSPTPQIVSPVPEAQASLGSKPAVTQGPIAVSQEPVVGPTPPADVAERDTSRAAVAPMRQIPTQSAQHSPRRGLSTREASLNRGSELRSGGYRPASEYRQPMSRDLAEGNPNGDYIGTFSAGPGGVRSFRYGP